MDTELGSVKTVINGVLHKYYVIAREMGADSNDPLNRIPVIYIFSPSKTITGYGFAVKVTSNIPDFYITETQQLHHTVIRFGLRAVRNNPSIREFLFTSTEYEKMQSEESLSGRQLRLEILRFIYHINYESPNEGISVFDILDNFKAEKKDIEDWLNSLTDEDYLNRIETNSSYWKNRGHVRAGSFKINPSKIDKIQIELNVRGRRTIMTGGETKILALISYSHKNKKLTGKVKKILEAYNINAFLAHEDIEPSDDWIRIILNNLENCDVLIPIITDEFRESKWTDQEAGYAQARGIEIISIMKKGDPHGFLNRFQAIKIKKGGIEKAAKEAAEAIFTKFQRRED